GLGDAAVDAVVGLPPAGVVLQADLGGRGGGDRLQGGLDAGAEVVRDPGEDVGGHGGDAVVGVEGTGAAVLRVRDGDSAGLVGDAGDRAAGADPAGADGPQEG